MYEKPEFNEKGEKILCEEKGKNAHMLMDVSVRRLKAGEKVRIMEQEKETAALRMQKRDDCHGFGGQQSADSADYKSEYFCPGVLYAGTVYPAGVWKGAVGGHCPQTGADSV